MDRQFDGENGCSRPPAVDDLDLVAAADGDARPDVLSHLAACKHCATRASELARLQNTLRSYLFRAFCITSDDLVEFFHHTLPADRHTAVALHLAECPHCTRELRLIERAARDPLQFLGDTRLPRQIRAQLLAPAGAGAQAMYGAPRSGGSVQYAYRAENLELTLRVARSVGRPGLVVLTGSLATDDSGLEDTLMQATAKLMHGEALLAVSPLNELGDFMFGELAPGEYQLLLQLGECEVVVESLSV